MENINKIDICVATYNRLAYLQNCIWSIIASTKVDYRLYVISDCSTDGTNEWLLNMKKYGKIHEVIINDENIGTAKSFNKVINASSTEWFVMVCDDMWFHRGWDTAAIGLINEFDDCGISNFWNYPYDIPAHSGGCKIINKHTYKKQSTGLAGTMVKRELFNLVGGFDLPDGIKMGYLAGKWCKKCLEVNIKRKMQYGTIPFYAEQMDRNNPGDPKKEEPKLSQEYLYSEYNKRRGEEKNKHKNLNRI